MKMTSAEIRSSFLEFFRSKNHQIVDSSSLVPHDDPTLLFTNAGMNQFKDTFLGLETRSYQRATSSQRCVRAGGKHNDLENVGYTARHHTFFEMLGNFSFGDYFKKDAIHFAWEFLTQVAKLPTDKLLVTVYASDDEAYDLWAKEVGVPEDRIIRIGDNKGAPYASDNFWQMGDTGPCGPCTEIFYDHGEHIWGGPPGSPEEDGDRFIEIWNLVFMQFNRQADGTMDPLPKPSVDTGMGLERVAAILQGVHSNYEIDIFQNLIAAAAKIIGCDDLQSKSLRVIADHIRSCCFLIADGVMPSNEGRGYVLRRIIRRAVRHGNKLGAQGTFFYQLVAELIHQMGEAYPELIKQREMIEKVLRLEEEQFGKTLDRGLQILDEALAELNGTEIPGDLVFKLYDTYGFPADLTADMARERSLTIDEAGFEVAMQAQRERAKQASNFGVDYNESMKVEGVTEFVGYDTLEAQAQLQGLYKKDGQAVESAHAGDELMLVLDKTSFYAESGGQAGDCGTITFAGGSFKVTDTQKQGQAFVHIGLLESGSLTPGADVKTIADTSSRQNTALNHSVTHLLHAALREILGEHVTQKGSLVEASRLRFDFSHLEPLSMETLCQVEARVNQEIRRNHSVQTQVMGLDQAKQAGAMALFGEKYDDDVRVVKMGDFSTELCGGTHVERTGDIGLFKITSEAGIAAGVRRIEAVTGEAAIALTHKIAAETDAASGLLKGDIFSLATRVRQTLDKLRATEKEVDALKAKLAAQAGSGILDQVVELSGTKVLVTRMEGVEAKSLRTTMDDLKNKLQSGIIVLGVASGDKVNLIAGVTKDLTGQVKAGELVNIAAEYVDGRGGGRPDMAQAGGTKPEGLDAGLNAARQWLEEKL